MKKYTIVPISNSEEYALFKRDQLLNNAGTEYTHELVPQPFAMPWNQAVAIISINEKQDINTKHQIEQIVEKFLQTSFVGKQDDTLLMYSFDPNNITKEYLKSMLLITIVMGTIITFITLQFLFNTH